eukprot:5862780-Heterocapsa_arctica.AAC.1
MRTRNECSFWRLSSVSSFHHGNHARLRGQCSGCSGPATGSGSTYSSITVVLSLSLWYQPIK